MLYQEWLNSLSLSEFIANQEDPHSGANPYRDAAEIVGEFPELKRKIIMRKEPTKWELFLKEGRAAMRQTCASPWGDHLVMCAEYMYGMPPGGWKITKRSKGGKRQADPTRSRKSSAPEDEGHGQADEYSD
jgi:hypothetical protein